ncbi:MAG TPA: Ig-like domain-containing protein [Terriglobales bacterium]|nr:Ig-like domain-containing protein [Terriglobales bacterium]
MPIAGVRSFPTSTVSTTPKQKIISGIKKLNSGAPAFVAVIAIMTTAACANAGGSTTAAVAASTGSAAVATTTTSSSAGVTIISPGSGATVTSPVHFQGKATPPSGRKIDAMRIYVDSTNAYTVDAASLNVSIRVSAGTHHINMQAWDSSGAVYVKSISIKVASSNSTSAPTGPSNSTYQNIFGATSKYVSQFSKSDGALLYTPQQIDPYFSNIAAIGMTKDAARMPQVTAWMKWYINHLNWPDRWGLYGTTYNYNVSSNGTETATHDADSTDSYAATFLSLVWNAWQSGDTGARSYILTLAYQLDAIGGVLIQTQQSDGLTWAKPNYQIKYLMDNCEAYRGLRDLASIYANVFHDTGRANYYTAAANSMQNGILKMWLGGKWAVYKDGIGRLATPNMHTWYADATAQVFPVLMGVVSASDSRAQQSWATFNAAWPGWATLSFNGQDAFPWCLVGTAAGAMGDKARLSTYIGSIQKKYVNSNFPWPFYNAEAGWFMRANSYMMGQGL